MAKAELRKPKPKSNPLKAADVTVIDYKDVALLRKFISDRGKIRARRVTGVTVQEQRKIALAIKNAREVALLPYSGAGRGLAKRRGEYKHGKAHFDPRSNRSRYRR
jgi:small subunit ribosomal protein S18